MAEVDPTLLPALRAKLEAVAAESTQLHVRIAGTRQSANVVGEGVEGMSPNHATPPARAFAKEIASR